MTETTQALLEVARLVAAGIVGALTVSLFNHLFTRSRERQSGRDTRRREFGSFVAGFKSQAAEGYYGGDHKIFVGMYRQTIPEMRRAAAAIEGDFRGERRAEFKRLVDAAIGIREGQADPGFRKRVSDSLDAILAFLDQKA